MVTEFPSLSLFSLWVSEALAAEVEPPRTPRLRAENAKKIEKLKGTSDVRRQRVFKRFELQYPKLKGKSDDAWPVSQQDCLSQSYGGVPFSGDPDRFGAMVVTAGRRGGRSRLQCGTHAYELAAKIPNVIHQQPCYCYCDRMGHNSLHSCFENTHGAQCATCLKELYYSYQQHQKGKTATQIRAGIVKGEWKQVDLQAAASIN
jgi:hypothetical protein